MAVHELEGNETRAKLIELAKVDWEDLVVIGVDKDGDTSLSFAPDMTARDAIFLLELAKTIIMVPEDESE